MMGRRKRRRGEERRVRLVPPRPREINREEIPVD